MKPTVITNPDKKFQRATWNGKDITVSMDIEAGKFKVIFTSRPGKFPDMTHLEPINQVWKTGEVDFENRIPNNPYLYLVGFLTAAVTFGNKPLNDVLECLRDDPKLNSYVLELDV